MVIWTSRARADLKAIHDRIKQDSPQNAQRVVREILRKADGLAEVPHMGRVAPELNDPHLREIPAYSWRILYHLRGAQVFVVTLVHKRRQPGAEDLAPATEPQSG
jgi:toxin ParE1/3/4